MEAEDTLNEKYEKAIVSFIDILGFKPLVRQNKPHQIGNLVHLFRELLGKPRITQTHTMNSICFSDLAVRVTRPINQTNKTIFKNMLFSELADLAQAQWEAMKCGFLVRGGVCYGDIYFFKNTVFGPALIDAYTIESKKAKVPIIMIAKELCESMSATEQENLIQQYPKGKFFIDYLGFIKTYEANQLPCELEMHRSITQKKLSQWEAKGEEKEKKEEFRSWWKWYEDLHSTQ